jgi:hypothetical protein
MNTSGSGALASPVHDLIPAGETSTDHRDEIASMVFAAMLAPPASPPPTVAPTPSPTPSSHSVASASWHPAASPMTPESATAASPPSALVTHIDSEVLGRVCVAVDQVGSTVRVVVTAERSEVFSAMQARQGQLLGQLQAAGVAVSSLALVRADPSGISLAPERSPGTTPSTLMRRDNAPDESEDPVRTRRRRSRTVNLTG